MAASTSPGSGSANGRGSASATCRRGAASFQTSPFATTSAWASRSMTTPRRRTRSGGSSSSFRGSSACWIATGARCPGGEQQLLAIARCLVAEPDLILLDEPTEGIQPSIVDEIAELLRDLNRRRGVAMVLVEQNLDFITELAGRILLLQKGAITGEVRGADAADPALIEEFTGFGAGAAARSAPAAPSLPPSSAPPAPHRARRYPIATPAPQRLRREDRVHDRATAEPRPAQGDRRRAGDAYVGCEDPGVPRRDAGHPRRLRRRRRDARPPAGGALSAHRRDTAPRRRRTR